MITLRPDFPNGGNNLGEKKNTCLAQVFTTPSIAWLLTFSQYFRIMKEDGSTYTPTPSSLSFIYWISYFYFKINGFTGRTRFDLLISILVLLFTISCLH